MDYKMNYVCAYCGDVNNSPVKLGGMSKMHFWCWVKNLFRKRV